ncbi:MAG: 50S ribosomal protein L23 [Gammaproteobacteria bacterium]|nr:50S ribosomal protein L23 [Gammaproteobacteria bacterium]MCW8888765.1 50S ribosomal protein L23 [Gammaproteobacteria bacterium]MCW8983480.1 50S ribosomal protein L23 [Gammaproteobacteria bacterium]
MNENRLMQVLLAPHISEKSASAADQSNQYVFKVTTDSNKAEIKGAVELMFKVDVEDVKVVNVKGKVKRHGQRLGKRSDWKKAYIRLKQGQEIDFVGSAN